MGASVPALSPAPARRTTSGLAAGVERAGTRRGRTERRAGRRGAEGRAEHGDLGMAAVSIGASVGRRGRGGGESGSVCFEEEKGRGAMGTRWREGFQGFGNSTQVRLCQFACPFFLIFFVRYYWVLTLND